MKKIKNIRHLKAEQQQLHEKRIRLEERMRQQGRVLLDGRNLWSNLLGLGRAFLKGQYWKRTGAKWFDLFK